MTELPSNFIARALGSYRLTLAWSDSVSGYEVALR